MYTKKTLVKRFHWYGWFICCLAALFYCYEYLLRIEPSVMVDQLRHHFTGLSAGGVGLLSSMFYWAYTPMQVVVGVMTDRYGPKRVLTLAIILCALGTFIFGHTHNLYFAGFGRFLVGTGSAFAFVGVLKLAAMWLPESQYPLFVGVTLSLGMLGALVGDVGMTWVVHQYGWEHVIIWSVIVGVILVPIFFIFVQEKIIHEPFHKPNDSFKLYFSRFWELLGRRDMIITGVIGCLMYLALSAFAEMWGIPFLQRVMPSAHLAASSINSMVFLGWLFGAPLAGWLSQRLKTRRLLMMYGSIAGVLTFSFIIIDPFISPWLMAVVLFIFGIFTSSQVLCFAVARDFVDVKYAATASGVINMLVMVSGMLLQPLMSHMLDWAWSGQMENGLRVYSVNDYRIAMLVMPVALLVSAVLCYLMKESFNASKLKIADKR